jgi:NAD(P)-dependent dehydrogenase (short-subunit alcohol dehydrogenase family)
MLTFDLKGKTTLVIGGARGIGAAIVRVAAQSGSNVVWTCRSDVEASEKLLRETVEYGIEAFYEKVDCTDEQATIALIAKIMSKWGHIDNLVHCAGYTSPVSMLDLDAAEWRRIVDINLNGAFISVRSVLEPMIANGGGSIVLIGSAAIVAGGGGRADYVSAKAGLEGLSRAITREFAPKGIRCNIVHPSLIETDLLEQRYPDPVERAKIASGVPLGRLGQPEDIANTTLFLISDLSSYITAQSIYVDGGRTFCK